MSKQDTESKIFEAARKVFVEKGFDGARMQNIAEEAGINKALLHYYFRSKDKLFEAVFENLIKELAPGIVLTLQTSETPEKKIENFIDLYFSFLGKNPFLPAFMSHESQRNPNFISELMEKNRLNSSFIIQGVKETFFTKGTSDKVLQHFIISLISLVIMPFLMRPVFQRILFDNSDEQYMQFIEERKSLIKTLAIQLHQQIVQMLSPNE